MIRSFKNTLFSVKEMYEMSCTKRGKILLQNMSEHYRRKLEYQNLHLTEGMTFTYENGFPELQPYNGPADYRWVSYVKRRKSKPENDFIHFFADDYKWADTLWRKPDQCLYSIRRFAGLFSPDYSLYADDNISKMFNKTQVYKSRFIGALAQNLGYNVIPTASCGDVDSFEYCYEGLPSKSVLAFCGTGLETHSHCEHWEYALRTLEEMKEPSLIIVYGKERDVVGLNTPLLFIEDEQTKFHRK